MFRKICLLICLLSLYGNAQEHAWVYFVDKPNVTSALQNPSTILTQRALDRKTLHNTPVDVRDVPVDEGYIATVKSQAGITVKAKSKWFNCVHVLGSQTAIQSLENLAIVDSVYFADPNFNTSSRGVISHNSAKNQDKLETTVDFTYGNTSNQVTMLNVQVLHQNDYTGAGMQIAVLDAGFPNVNTISGLQRLRDNNDLLGGYDFVSRSTNFNNPSLNNHGTLVLSDMAGFVQDQFVGTAPDAGYYVFRTEDAASETPVEESYWVEAAERADSLGVDVINSSLGYTTFDNDNYSYSMADMDGNTTFITKGANIAVEKGILVVTSAGNSGNSSTFYKIGAPGDGDAFAIGAVNSSGNYAAFSSIGPSADGRVKPDVMAQGQASAVITQNDNLSYANGTSFSSPIMAGAIASFWQADPSRTNLEIMQLVRESASLYNNPTNQMGYGIPDFSQALTALGVEMVSENAIQLYPNPVHDVLRISTTNHSLVDVILYNVLGKQVLSAQQVYEVNVSQLEAGIYIAKVNLGGESLVQKIVKQ